MPEIQINNIRHFYKTLGQGKPLVLVHGMGVDYTCFNEQIEAFSPFYQVLVYDLRGHGQSEKSPLPADFDMGRLADDLKGLLDALDLEQVLLLGHSMGGNVALSFALKFPGMVERLILASTFARRRLSVAEKVQLLLANLLPVKVIARPFAARCLAKPDQGNFMRIMNAYLAAGKKTMIYTAKKIGEIDCRDQLSQIACKTLIIHGKRDRAVPYPNAEILHRGIKGSRLHTVEGGGHVIGWENTEEFNRVVLEFLKAE